MASSNGRMVRFNESTVRIMGRSASGVRGINLDGGILVGMEIVEPNEYVLVITEKGYGKKTPVDEYRITKHLYSSSLDIFNKEVTFSSLSKDNKLIIGNPLDCLLYSGIS